jgi:hypothetical protein
MASDDAYILVKGDLGLGNRILCLLSAVLLARVTGRRLAVDWRDPLYSADGRNAFDPLLRLDLAVPLDSLPDTDSVRPAVWRGHLQEPASAMRKRGFGESYVDEWSWEPFCVGLDRIDHPERVLVFTSFFEQIEPLRQYLTDAFAGLRSMSAAAILQRLWADHLTLTPALKERVEVFRQVHFGAETLGVHVRDSDRRTRIAAIEATAARLIALHPQMRIFLASDSAEALRRYTARFGDVITTEKWYPPPGEAMHRYAGRPDPTAGAAAALVDMHLLAECDRLIVDSRSSFGRLAALRQSSRPGAVVDLHPGRFIPLALRRSLLRRHTLARRWWRDGSI